MNKRKKNFNLVVLTMRIKLSLIKRYVLQNKIVLINEAYNTKT